MKHQHLFKTLMGGVIAAAFVVPLLAGAQEQAKEPPVLETSKTTMGSVAINQEVVQVLRKSEMALVTLNVIGQPGVSYKVEYSGTGARDSYKALPDGKGVIGGNGYGSVSFDLRKLGKQEVRVKVTTSDKADFSKSRVMPKPMVLLVEDVKIRDRGAFEDLQRIERRGGCTGNVCFAPPPR